MSHSNIAVLCFNHLDSGFGTIMELMRLHCQFVE